MQSRADWPKWAEYLHRYKMDGIVAWLLDAASPFRFFGAQFLYIFQPFLGGKTVEQLADLLADEQHSQMFAEYLAGKDGL